jgi:outer membrane murein-binding lipoprotein Lpp
MSRKSKLFVAASISILAALTGCVSGVKRYDSASDTAGIHASAAKQLRNVSLSLNKEAQAKISDNMKFDPDALLAVVRGALTAKNMIAKDDDASLPSLEILLTDIRVRSTFSAVLLGVMAGADTVTGDVMLKDSNGAELKKYEVSASYALGGVAGVIDEVRVGWLYDKFAEHTVAELDLSH